MLRRRIIFLSCLMPLALLTAAGNKYHPHDVSRVYQFLITENQGGIPNWYRMNMIEMAGEEDADLWIEKVPGIVWTEDEQDKQLKRVDWSFYYVSGRLDLSGCAQLEELYCQSNSLVEVDVSNCSNLRLLYCQQNAYKASVLNGIGDIYDLSSLEGLNVQGCNSLEELRCNDNYLSELDVAGLANLKVLDCSRNRLLFSKLPAIASLPKDVQYDYAPQRYAHPENIHSLNHAINLSSLLLPGSSTTVYINGKAYQLEPDGMLTLPDILFVELYLQVENSRFPDFRDDERLTYTIKHSNY